MEGSLDEAQITLTNLLRQVLGIQHTDRIPGPSLSIAVRKFTVVVSWNRASYVLMAVPT